MSEILQELAESGIRAGGILAPGKYNYRDEKEYDLKLYPGEKKFKLSSRKKKPGWQAIGNFWFNPQAIEAGLRHLGSLHTEQYHLYLLDEIGPFELDGLLWAKAIPALLDEGVPMIWCVRKRIIQQVCNKWNLENPEIISLEKEQREKSKGEIRIWLRKNIQELY